MKKKYPIFRRLIQISIAIDCSEKIEGLKAVNVDGNVVELRGLGNISRRELGANLDIALAVRVDRNVRVGPTAPAFSKGGAVALLILH